MRGMPLDIGPLHFVGIGGIGMSGIAEILHNLGYQIQGSDIAESANVQRLRKMGIKVMIGHLAENVTDARVVVVSSAIKLDNPEIAEARNNLIPIVRRAEMLAELMRFKSCVAVGGTHGKTTTTSMIAALLDGGHFDPTVINGGIINAYGTNARLGEGDWMVVEADESDGTFIKLPATISVITNIDPEHMEFYGSIEALHDAFATFVKNIPFYGFSVLCIDHPVVQSMIGRIQDRRIVTYGLSPQASVRATNIRTEITGNLFDVTISSRSGDESRVIKDCHLPMLGNHNILNSLAAISVASELGMADEAIRKALSNFSGVKRRFTKTGEVNGITIIDDYGHHPVEIAAVLQAARQAIKGESRVIAVVQPHRYSRLSDHFEGFCSCFNDADQVIVADVYAAGETPIEGADKDSLVTGLRTRGHRNAIALPDPEKLAEMVADYAEEGDLVVCLGAGNISAWAHALPGQLEKLLPAQKEGHH
ncbi:UDP-N-acetylmuramate--L-alanine ligase [Kiloniella laminariae]|uniref:UDP-N-acetylmuramate--L-alanine ligase n=1 Tax=Kiloniella laminariae TaxID=454162 RepID=A0ABT4LDX4_9PROT|nr:UDP-N-acetylmuramate--L-alanine ligase [Kiloniella laminariae]MCZ4279292.1 UDP-N-acetylmuramate--L-alanine ligase [Kiloniella laminariae]